MRQSCKGLVDYIADRYAAAAEIGVGHFPDVARALTQRGLSVFATDVEPFSHDGLTFLGDDITEPDTALYRHVDVLYAVRPPPELVPYMRRLARRIPADLIVKPLASDHVGGRLIRHQGTVFFLWTFLTAS